MRWGNVGEVLGFLRVRRTLYTHSVAYFDPPKSPRSRRIVTPHHEAEAALRDQRAMLEDEGLPTGDGDLVFPSRTGSSVNPNNLRRRHLKPALRRAVLPEVTLHKVRHTFASIMLREWMVPAAVVSEALGHKSIGFTFGLYGHLVSTAQADIMRRLNEAQKRTNEAC